MFYISASVFVDTRCNARAREKQEGEKQCVMPNIGRQYVPTCRKMRAKSCFKISYSVLVAWRSEKPMKNDFDEEVM